MSRKFFSFLLLTALMIAAGSMACLQTVEEFDKQDETAGAT
ncbi:hypothetical protein OV203_43205 [Nannocystis sp. ILAH1]|nr:MULTISPECIES: hypothetical protein [unclassified Nannocystis]MCY0994026.1 hypothetical protein [Nannocystis sp. ILAH1]MCY1066995.1 hypothetical protein [Nannocystis sp. RBIL2]